MQLPENFEQFKSVVIEKIRTYCDTNIWPFDYEIFSGWLNNFENALDEYLALQILDSLIVRSYDMARASYSRVLFGPIWQYISEETSIPIGKIDDWKSHLRSGALNKQIRFAPVKLLDDQGESGGAIYRLLSSDVNTDRYGLAKASVAPELLILIDDFIGSGDQFSDFAKEFDLANKLHLYKIIYCPLIAFSEGIEKINNLYPDLTVIAGEYLDETDSFLRGEPNDQFRNDPQNTVADVKKHLQILKTKYSPKMEDWLGYNEAALPLSFEWGCPNQTPPILFMDYSPKKKGWSKLFNRRAL
ncbi:MULTISPECIES: phosphoribosyltransferase-like protein [unclassified Methylophaga]|mgnify:CR=1 FL=1|jgi:hypothetical protein|uniref:phosphoribosyltransferase-like protein n=1 Tax=unclassified Methylophaga TaxID=2629249 RepID=UPI00259C6A6A|nr:MULTISPECIES: hypothetical protein [unclassified Methylophaga]|tara:strand:+ start:4228 stop:5130 length:903 start_codon:yes stop_codon:yes gene_type:complete